MKKMFLLFVALLVAMTFSYAGNGGCDCQSKKNEQTTVGSKEAQLNNQINELVDSVEGKLDLPENAMVAEKVAQLIRDRDRLAEKRRKLEAEHKKCLAKQND